MIQGLVIRGSWNIFIVRPQGEAGTGADLECRIKGKVLRGVEGCYNPLAPGDLVRVEVDGAHQGKGLIVALEERKNLLTRHNQKGLNSQILAANVDYVLCVTTPASPPWRPRFLDRLLLQADIAGLPPWIICNKWDLAQKDTDMEERMEDFRRLGYPLMKVSVLTGEGMDELRRLTTGRLSVLVGQSGVGKSSLINTLLPDFQLKVGNMNEKYDRGNHTTTMSVLLEKPGTGCAEAGIRLIDTPGIRRLVPDGVSGTDLILSMREFAPLAGKCSFGMSCSHRTEPGCKILEAVAAGVIHEDRYESFIRIQDELLGLSQND